MLQVKTDANDGSCLGCQRLHNYQWGGTYIHANSTLLPRVIALTFRPASILQHVLCIVSIHIYNIYATLHGLNNSLDGCQSGVPRKPDTAPLLNTAAHHVAISSHTLTLLPQVHNYTQLYTGVVCNGLLMWHGKIIS